MTAPLLVTEGLVAGWERPVTPPLSLSLAAGEIVGLVGPNGVGKSTYLSALTGVALVFAGRLDKRPGLRLALQTQATPPFGGLPLCGSDLLKLTGATSEGLPPWLADKLGWRLDSLSGGQRHFLALWAVLRAPADVILLDEPTNNLDTAGVAHLGDALRRRAGEGAGLLVVSHDHEFVDTVCHRIVEVGEGRP
ncbi:MAG TPA: ATP-binding cassette domain-containing protein [Rhodocyclaceae bacterium]|nr:ATP-binding cassette domain-containing protein [Rhodocyclaceae bacterium]